MFNSTIGNSRSWILMIPILALVACGAPQPSPRPFPPTPTSIPPIATAGPAPGTALESITTEYSVIHKHIPYVPGGNAQQKLSVYLPVDVGSGPGMKYPVVVLAHATDGGKDDPLLADTVRFANQLGYAAVTIDYRDDDGSCSICARSPSGSVTGA
jgi:hypothetical protein